MQYEKHDGTVAAIVRAPLGMMWGSPLCYHMVDRMAPNPAAQLPDLPAVLLSHTVHTCAHVVNASCWCVV
eukprot:351689-Chlamydomonas_euryale.AAC.6